MSYASIDQSVQDSDPVLLFQFARGATVWRYCALPFAFTALGETWLPEVIAEPTGTKSAGDVLHAELGITLPITNALAASFTDYAPDAVTTVIIRRTHYSDPTNGTLVWKGRVVRASTAIATVTLTCENVFTSLRRMGLREVYLRKCRHMLYGPGCNVDRSLYSQAVTVTGVAGALVTVDVLNNIYTGGNIEDDQGGLHKIVAQNGLALTILRQSMRLLQLFSAHPSGFAVLLYPGCDKSTATCRATFATLGNHGGFPGMRGINPMDGVTNAF